MQAKLPDVNAAIVRHRSNALKALESNDVEIATISLNAINALLPEDYKVEVNTEKYEQAISEKYFIICSSCESEYPVNDVEPYDLYLSSMDQLILGQKVIRAWSCTKCNNEEPYFTSKRKVLKYANPIYTKIVPERPPRKGLINRVGYEQRFRQWFDIVLSELEQQISLYRTDWQAQQSDDPNITEMEED